MGTADRDRVVGVGGVVSTAAVITIVARNYVSRARVLVNVVGRVVEDFSEVVGALDGADGVSALFAR